MAQSAIPRMPPRRETPPISATGGPANAHALVLSEHVGETLVLSLNRPERRNAWSVALGREFAQLVTSADSDPTVRTIVVTGAGSAFCAGADLKEVAGGQDAIPFEPFVADIESTLRVRKPVIAAINGAAIGLGLVQAVYSDIRFCAFDAKLATGFARRGFVGEFGLASLLSRLVGLGRASDLLLSGRVITGSDAYSMGLVEFATEQDNVLPAALEYARDLNENCAPTAMAAIKTQIRSEPTFPFWEAIRQAKEVQRASLSWPDAVESFRAMTEKRDARYAPLD